MVIDRTGAIQYVNNAWVAFGQSNGIRKDYSWIAINYLACCRPDHEIDGDIAENVICGIRAVIEGNIDHFQLDYPCHCTYEQRWFHMKVTPLASSPENLFLIRHINITDSTVAKKLSQEDPLTGLHNRRHFETFFDSEWRRCHRHKRNLTLVYLDLDNFKQVNDSLGHSAGDRSLIRFADLLGDYTRRPGDTAARIGGDEFALILADSSYLETLSTANTIVSSLERMRMPIDENTVLTVSIGFINGVPTDEEDIHIWWEIADSLLYKAKSEGGNTVFGTEKLKPR